MKKIALILALIMMMSVLAACGNETGETTAAPETTAVPETTTEATTEAPTEDPTEESMDEMTTEEIPEFTLSASEEFINKIYENVTVELPLMSMPVDIADPDAVVYMTGLTDVTGVKEIAVSEPMMGSQAYSLVLLMLEEGADGETIAQNIFDNIDTRKWICVEATEKQAAIAGDMVMFIMLDPQYGVTTDQIVEAFTTACGGAVDSVIK